MVRMRWRVGALVVAMASAAAWLAIGNLASKRFGV